MLTSITSALILAGGRGTRLGATETPKPLYLVDGEPVLFWIIRSLQLTGVETIHISVDYLKDKIVSTIKKENFELQIDFIDSEPTIAKSIATGLEHFSSDTFVMVADGYHDLDWSAFGAMHLASKQPFSISSVFHPGPAKDFGWIDESGPNPSFTPPQEHQQSDIWVDMGIWCLQPGSFFEENMGNYKKEMFKRKQVYIYHHHGYWFDIGTPETYAQANTFARSQPPESKPISSCNYMIAKT